MLDAVTPRATRRLTEGVQMVAGATPQHGYIGGESERLSNADLSERDRHSEEDHSAHAAGKICKSCGRPIEAEQPARRRRLFGHQRGADYTGRLLVAQTQL